MWHVSGDSARFICGQWSGQIALEEPEHGLWLSWAEKQLATVLRLEAGGFSWGPLSEHYVRGNDLVLTYAEQATDRVRTQLYWRLATSASQEVSRVELVVSVETSRLDAFPDVRTRSTWKDATAAGCETLPPQDVTSDGPLQTHCLLVRPTAADLSVLVTTLPSDPLLKVSTTAADVELESVLFSEPLEKGVLRRSRIAVNFLPRDDDVSRADRTFADFCHSPPPLTT